MNETKVKNEIPSSQRISDYVEGLGGWRGDLVARIRKLVLEAAPGITEEWKWNTPVWAQKGNVLAAGVFKDHVKLNFFKGASLEDPNGLFNAGLDAKTTRAINYYEGDKINDAALKDLIRAAVAENVAGGKKK